MWNTQAAINLPTMTGDALHIAAIWDLGTVTLRQPGQAMVQCQSDSTERTNSQMGVSENSVPLHPMVNDHYPY